LSLQNAYFILYDEAQKKGLLALKHSITFTKNSNYYTDAGADFNLYQNQYYFNSKNSSDSVLFKQVSNSLEVYTPDRQQAIICKAGIQSDQFRYCNGPIVITILGVKNTTIQFMAKPF